MGGVFGANICDVSCIIGQADFAVVDRHVGAAAHMTILAAAIHRAIDEGTRGCHIAFLPFGAFGQAAYGDIRHVDITREERRGILVARCVGDVGCCLTAASAKDVACGQVVFLAASGTHRAANDVHRGFSAVHEVPGIAARSTSPQVGDFLAVASRGIVVRAASIVALAHRGHVATTVDVAHHIAAVHGHRSAAIHLACCEAVDFCVMILSRGTQVQEAYRIGVFALAAAVDGMANQALVEGEVSRV